MIHSSILELDAVGRRRNEVVRRRAPHQLHLAPSHAGSERNTENCLHIPGPACSTFPGNSCVPEGAEGRTSRHLGIFGIGDLTPANKLAVLDTIMGHKHLEIRVQVSDEFPCISIGAMTINTNGGFVALD